MSVNCRFLKYAFVAFILAVTCSLHSSTAGPIKHVRKYILILNSYHQGYLWSDNLVKGFRDELADMSDSIVFVVEYMDTRRKLDDASYLSDLVDIISHKYYDKKFEVIVTTDDYAYNFMRQHGDNLFFNTPVVFCGVNSFLSEHITDKPMFTGIVEGFDIEGNIDLVLQLQPDTQKVVFLSDKTPRGQRITENIRAHLHKLSAKKIQAEIWDSFTIEGLNRAGWDLPTGTVVVYLSVTSDKEGTSFYQHPRLQEFAQGLTVPLYVSDEHLLNVGTVGGSLKSGYLDGQKAATIVRQILTGTDVAEIPVQTEPNSYTMLDYKQLQRFGIDPKRAPANTRFVNRPVSFYEAHKTLVWIYVSVVLVLLLLIGLLTFHLVWRHIAERRLRESEERYRTLVENLGVGVALLGPDLRVIAVNRQFQEWHPDLDVTCRPVCYEVQNTPPQKEICSYCPVVKTLEDGLVHEAITETPCSEGIKRFKIVASPIMDENNKVINVIELVDDVTEKMRIEEVMIQSEKMLSVGGLAAGMAHEINNPLGGILQNIQVIRNRLSGDIPKNARAAEDSGTTMVAIREYLERRGIDSMIDSVSESGKQVARIVENMLSFSRKGDSRFILHDLANLLDQTVELAENDYSIRKKHDFRQIEIQREYSSDVPAVPCEGSKIQQVFLNLLKNGAQAMYGGNKTESPRLVLRIFREDGFAHVEVEDNGPGMDEETRKRVFEPFFTTKEAGVGTGLGLSVSYFIIAENHGGTMKVESTAGIGTKFIVRLPLERKSHDSDATQAE